MFLPVFCSIAALQQSSIDLTLAAQYFQEAKWIADEDGAKLWGIRLDGPMLFADGDSRTVVANMEPPGMGLKKTGDVWFGNLPREVLVANTAIDWKGEKWTMVGWPLPTTRAERARLMMHELFHRIQDKIGLPAEVAKNNHLDTMQGRVWLQLEIRALRQAMLAETPDRNQYVEDALLFRDYRHSLFPGSKKSEDRMEVHEGMAEFTGMMLRGTWEPETRYAEAYRMLSFSRKRSFPNSFAYETGPAYGLLLNVLQAIKFDKITWRQGLSPASSLTDKVAELIGYRAPAKLASEAERRGPRYGLTELRAVEQKREAERLAKEKAYRALLVEGPVLVIPLKAMNFTYDPNGVFPLADLGTVYPETTISDEWGQLTVTKGALISPNFQRVTVAAPASASTSKGDGWTLTLNAGWKLVSGKRAGDYTVAKG